MRLVGRGIIGAQEILRRRRKLGCEMRLAVIPLHQANRPFSEIYRCSLSSLNKGLAILNISLA